MSIDLLVPLDGSPLSAAALPHASVLAERLGETLLLTRVHRPLPFVVGPPEAGGFVTDPAWDAAARIAEQEALEHEAAAAQKTTTVPITTVFRTGVPAEEIVAVARERNVRAIVCSTHGMGGWAPHWLGSVADAVIRHVSCPVLAMTPVAAAQPPRLHSILVLLDGFESSNQILPHAEWVARVHGASLELLRVVSPPWQDNAFALSGVMEDPFDIDTVATGAKEWLDAKAADVRRRGTPAKATVIVGTNPARTILEHAKQTAPDAIAMVTYGRGMSRLFLGSVADKVLRTSGRPTLLVRPVA